MKMYESYQATISTQGDHGQTAPARATARVRPYYRRRMALPGSSIVGAGLTPTLEKFHARMAYMV